MWCVDIFFLFWNEYSKTVESRLNPCICVSKRIEMIRIVMNIPEQLLAILYYNKTQEQDHKGAMKLLSCQYYLG